MTSPFTIHRLIRNVTTNFITNLFEAQTVKVISVQKQSKGSNNCGLFVIAVCMAVLLKKNPAKLVFDETKMRPHLYECFTKDFITDFPSTLQ